MKSHNSNDIYELQFKIDKNLNELPKRRIHPINADAKTKDSAKEIHYIKWHTIKRHMQQLQKHRNNDLKVVKPLLKNDDLMGIINRIMLLQKSLIGLSGNIAKYRRVQMGVIFFQCSLSIVFNAYNLVVFLLKMANNNARDVPLSLAMLLFFYGYHILSSLTDIILSIICYFGVYESIRTSATRMDELSMYIFDNAINARISQLSAYVYNNLKIFTLLGLYNIDGTLVTSIISGTTTYIIILIQYSGDGEICKKNTAMDLNTNTTHNTN